MKWLTFFLFFLFLFSYCNKAKKIENAVKIPTHFPEITQEQKALLTPGKIELGKQLFFDKGLSRDSTVSCNSCHFQHLAFTDGLTKSVGINNRTTERNGLPLFNLAYKSAFFRDGGIPTIHQQALAPITDENEMDLTFPELIERLKTDENYVQQARENFDREIDVFVITRALSAFQLSLISGESLYDKFLISNDSSLFDSEQRLGMQLFFSDELACSSCHNGIFFTNNSLQNNGLYEIFADSGRARITGKNSDNGKFLVPTLRNLAFTKPYMHDGSISTLEEVIDHYAEGGGNHFNQSEEIGGFTITEKQKQALERFLYTMSDSLFIRKQF